MATLKTKATGASVEDYIRSRASEEQLEDCRKLMAIFRKVTKKRPKMWGPSIVGYGFYRYTLESGRPGEMCLADLDVAILERLIVGSVATIERRYG